MQEVSTAEVLDCCRTVHHILQTLASLGHSKEERNKLHVQQRLPLRIGQWLRVVEELSDRQCEEEGNAELAAEISYILRHDRLRGPSLAAAINQRKMKATIALQLNPEIHAI